MVFGIRRRRTHAGEADCLPNKAIQTEGRFAATAEPER